MRRRLSSELVALAAGVQALTSGGVTPCSNDTGYSEPRMETTPSSLVGQFTPSSSASSQGGGGTPYSSRSGTPFSQDSGFTSTRLTADFIILFLFDCYVLDKLSKDAILRHSL